MSTSDSCTSAAAPASGGRSEIAPAPRLSAPNCRRDSRADLSSYWIMSSSESSSHMVRLLGWACAPAQAGYGAPGSGATIDAGVCCTQRILLHLAHRISGQLRDQQYAFRDLVASQARAEGLDDLRFRQHGSGRGHDDRSDALPEIRMRSAEDGALRDARQRLQLRLDFPGIDIAAAADDEILDPPCDAHVAIAIDAAQISGLEPAVGGELGAGSIGVSPVTGKDVRSRDLECTDHIRGGVHAAAVRSEERRVGKEGRSRWSPDHLKKKEEDS